jgi:hypothetical protein
MAVEKELRGSMTVSLEAEILRRTLPIRLAMAPLFSAGRALLGFQKKVKDKPGNQRVGLGLL